MRAARLVLAALLAAGCSLPLGRPGADRPGPDQLLARAEIATQAGEYRRAETAYREALEALTATRGADRALLGLGRLHAATDNPERDYRQAYQYFDRLLTEYPHSRLAREAGAWRDLVGTVQTQREEMRLLRRETDRVRQEMQRERLEVLRMRQEMQRERLEVLRMRQDLERLKLRDLELERSQQRFR